MCSYRPHKPPWFQQKQLWKLRFRDIDSFVKYVILKLTNSLLCQCAHIIHPKNLWDVSFHVEKELSLYHAPSGRNIRREIKNILRESLRFLHIFWNCGSSFHIYRISSRLTIWTSNISNRRSECNLPSRKKEKPLPCFVHVVFQRFMKYKLFSRKKACFKFTVMP